MQMAIGMATYNPEIDKGYMEVFRRADSAMYEDKKRKKEQGRFSVPTLKPQIKHIINKQ